MEDGSSTYTTGTICSHLEGEKGGKGRGRGRRQAAFVQFIFVTWQSELFSRCYFFNLQLETTTVLSFVMLQHWYENASVSWCWILIVSKIISLLYNVQVLTRVCMGRGGGLLFANGCNHWRSQTYGEINIICLAIFRSIYVHKSVFLIRIILQINGHY
jgi:hypothetical protein